MGWVFLISLVLRFPGAGYEMSRITISGLAVFMSFDQFQAIAQFTHHLELGHYFDNPPNAFPKHDVIIA